MSKKVFDQIAEGLEEAIAVARGEVKPFRLHVPAADAVLKAIGRTEPEMIPVYRLSERKT